MNFSDHLIYLCHDIITKNFSFSNTLIYKQKPAELSLKFPPASAVFCVHVTMLTINSINNNN